MNNNKILLNKKTLTKLLNKKYREKILSLISQKKISELKINAYSQYVVNSQILQRIKEYSENSKFGWGFPQLNLLCCVKKDNLVEKKFFEFNIINHFLKDKDGDSAIDIVKCILILWYKLDKNIKNFDYEIIDKELVKIDKEIEEKKKKDEQINQTGQKIKEAIEPIINSLSNESYEVISNQIKIKAEEILNQFKNNKEVSNYSISLNRNFKESIEKNNLFIDIGYKIDEKDDFTILICNIKLNKNEKKEKVYTEVLKK